MTIEIMNGRFDIRRQDAQSERNHLDAIGDLLNKARNFMTSHGNP